MRFLRRSLVGLFLLALTVGLLAVGGNVIFAAFQDKWAEQSKPRPHRERVFSVTVTTVKPVDLVPVMTAFGEIRSRRTLDIRAASAGTIVQLADGFIEGGTVTSGSLLLGIDPQNAQSALDRAQSDLTEALAEVDEAARALALAIDEVKSAKAQAELRGQALIRQQDLKARGVGTDTAVEIAALAASGADQAVLSRRQALQVAEARQTRAKTRLARQNINLAEADRHLADTKIYAGFSGTLSNVTAVQGGLVAKNERLAQLVDADALEVSFRLSTSQYARLLGPDAELGHAKVAVSLDVFGVDMLAKGRISRESAAVGEGQTGRLLFATLDQGARGFKPGDFVTVKINEPQLNGVIKLPAAAVDAAQTVLVIGDDDRLQQQQIEVLSHQGNDIIVRAAPILGREVVLARSPLLGVGIKVNVLRSGQSAAKTPEMLSLTDARRAKLVAFIQANKRMPKEAKARILAQLAKEMVPAKTVKRIESRMGG